MVIILLAFVTNLKHQKKGWFLFRTMWGRLGKVHVTCTHVRVLLAIFLRGGLGDDLMNLKENQMHLEFRMQPAWEEVDEGCKLTMRKTRSCSLQNMRAQNLVCKTRTTSPKP